MKFSPITRNLSNVSFLSGFVFLLTGVAYGGGYLAVDTSGNPYKWNAPVPVRLDPGRLGQLSKAQADALALDAMAQWTSSTVAGSTIQFQRGPDLIEDHGDGLGTDPNFDLGKPADGITAVIYDQKGLLIDTLGANASKSVVGFAGPNIPDDYSPAPLTEGLAVLNGRFIDDNDVIDDVFDIPEDMYRGAFTHEIGHLLNLDHAQAALQYSETGIESATLIPGLGGGGLGKTPDYRGLPTMFPIVMPDIRTLELDDKAWIKQLYPGPAGLDLGSITGTARDFLGNPVNGVNITAFNADDPTQMVTCVTGFTDPHPAQASGSGTYRIPSLPRDSVWIVDSEAIADLFTGGSSVGPLDPPAVLPGSPEFLNEPGIESTTDFGGLTTAFAIPPAPAISNVTNVDLRFNDINDFDTFTEIESGNDPATAQKVTVTPGKFMMVSGFADPNEPGATYYFGAGNFVDFFEVDNPAGLELNQLYAIGETYPVDVWVLDEQPGNEGGDFVPLTGTGFLSGEALSLYLDYSRMGTGTGYGKFYIGVVTPDPFFSTSSVGPTNYTIGMLFTASDRDAVVLKGTQVGGIDPLATTIRLVGRGFKNLGGAPLVSIEKAGVTVSGVTFVNSNTLDVNVTGLNSLSAGASVPIQVTNQPQSGGFAGRRTEKVYGAATSVTDWELY